MDDLPTNMTIDLGHTAYTCLNIDNGAEFIFLGLNIEEGTEFVYGYDENHANDNMPGLRLA